jgi:hypothetical protein
LFRPDTFRRAVLETMVIAIGVFAAIAADNWNDDRKDRLLEQQFLESIALDLTKNANHIEGVQASASRYKDSLNRIINAVQTGQNTWDSPEDFVIDLVQCTYLGLPRLSSLAWDELRSTGSMRLLRDSDFKRKLAAYYDYFLHRSQHHPEYRRKEAALEDSLLGVLPLAGRLAVSDNRPVGQTNIKIPITIAEMQQIPGLVSRLEDMVWVQHRMLTRYGWVIEDSHALLQDIEALRH